MPERGDGAGEALSVDLEIVVEVPTPAGLDPDGLRGLVGFVLRREGRIGPWTIAIVLTGDERLRALHWQFMGIDEATDVMTFPLGEPGANAGAERGGDVIVSVERAAAQAAEYGQTAAQEVRFLVVHGLLHLCGWDDVTETDRVRMLARQTELLAAFDGSEGAPNTG